MSCYIIVGWDTVITHTCIHVHTCNCGYCALTLLCIIGRAGASPPSLTTWARCLYVYIYGTTDRPTGYRNVSTRFFFNVTSRHFTGHNTALTGQGKPGFSKEEREHRATESDETREARLHRTPERASCF